MATPNRQTSSLTNRVFATPTAANRIEAGTRNIWHIATRVSFKEISKTFRMIAAQFPRFGRRPHAADAVAAIIAAGPHSFLSAAAHAGSILHIGPRIADEHGAIRHLDRSEAVGVQHGVRRQQ